MQSYFSRIQSCHNGRMMWWLGVNCIEVRRIIIFCQSVFFVRWRLWNQSSTIFKHLKKLLNESEIALLLTLQFSGAVHKKLQGPFCYTLYNCYQRLVSHLPYDFFLSFYSWFSKQQQQYFHSLCANSGTFAMKEIIIFKIVLYKRAKK